jgi:hypothetical protein
MICARPPVRSERDQITEPQTAGLCVRYASMRCTHTQTPAKRHVGRARAQRAGGASGKRPAFTRLIRSLALVCIKLLTPHDQFARPRPAVVAPLARRLVQFRGRGAAVTSSSRQERPLRGREFAAVVAARKQMAVGIRGHLYRGVTEPRLHQLERQLARSGSSGRFRENPSQISGETLIACPQCSEGSSGDRLNSATTKDSLISSPAAAPEPGVGG